MPALVLALLVAPSSALAQRDAFFSAFLALYKTLGGIYGDEGPGLVAHLETLESALRQWDAEILTAEAQLRPRLVGADAETRMQIHTLLASLHLERGRFDDALREFDEDIRIDSRRAAFHRYRGLLLQALGRQGAADAFRAAWLIDPADPQNAYRLLAVRSALTTPQEHERALARLIEVEQEVIAGTRPRAAAPFTTLGGIVDDAGGAVAFVPAAYARGFTLVLAGKLDTGVAALIAAARDDPLVVDEARTTATMARGAAALRLGRVAEAIEQFGATTTAIARSAEPHRMLGTAYGVNGDSESSLRHLREAVRLNARDERAWHALVLALDESGAVEEAADTLRAAIAALPDAGALRWQLATIAARRQQTDNADLALIAAIDRYVVLAGRAELHLLLARLAHTHLDYQGAIGVLERAATLIPNNGTVHKTLGRAYLEDGRDGDGYAELVAALMLNPGDVETLTGLGRAHAAARRLPDAIAILRRAVAVGPTDQQAVHALGDALVRAGGGDEGAKWLQESDRLRARSISEERLLRTIATLTLEASISSSEGDHARAVDLSDQLVQLRPGHAATHLRLADALAAARRFEDAEKAYRAAGSLGAGSEGRRRLAEVYDALGRTSEGARERAGYVQMRLEELRRRAAGGPSG